MKNFKLTLIASIIMSATLSHAVSASSHREAPNVTRMPTADSTDFYAFNSYESGRGDYVTLIANYILLQLMPYISTMMVMRLKILPLRLISIRC
jgi:hypothetical protein